MVATVFAPAISTSIIFLSLHCRWIHVWVGGRLNTVQDRVRRTRERIAASDPGLGHLRQAGSVVIGAGTVLAVEYGFATLIHAGAQGTLVAMLLGAVTAMMGATALSGSSWGKVRTAVFFPVAIGVGLIAGAAVAGHTDLMLVVFVFVMFAAVFVRRFGAAFFTYGFMGWMGYFFASFLGSTIATVPMLIAEVAIATAWILLLSVTVLRSSPARTVGRMLRAFGAHTRGIAAVAADLLEADPGDERRRRRLRRTLQGRHLRLAESALMIDGTLADRDAAPVGWPAAALRRHLVDAQLTIDALAMSVATLAAVDAELGRSSPVTARAALALRRLGAADYGAAEITARALADSAAEDAAEDADLPWRSTADGEVRAALAARRAGTAVLEYVELVRRWNSPPRTAIVEDFEPAVMMAMGNLPGSPSVAADVAPRAHRWNPLGRLDLTTRQAVQVAIAGGLAILLGSELSPTRYYWAVIAAFVAFAGTSTRSETFIKAGNRVLGTLVGLFAAIWLAELTRGSTALVLVVILASVFLGFYLLRVSYAFMIFFITIMVAQLYSVLNEFSDGLLVLRLEETAIGAAVGAVVALFVVPTSTRDTVRAARTNLMSSLSDLLDAVARRINPSAVPAAASGADGGDGPQPAADLDGLVRTVENRLRQLTLVSAPLTRPMLLNNDPRRVSRELRLYAASATYARALTVQLRRASQVPVRLASASLSLAAASRTLADPASGRSDQQVLDDLAARRPSALRPRGSRRARLARRRPTAHPPAAAHARARHQRLQHRHHPRSRTRGPHQPHECTSCHPVPEAGCRRGAPRGLARAARSGHHHPDRRERQPGGVRLDGRHGQVPPRGAGLGHVSGRRDRSRSSSGRGPRCRGCRPRQRA